MTKSRFQQESLFHIYEQIKDEIQKQVICCTVIGLVTPSIVNAKCGFALKI